MTKKTKERVQLSQESINKILELVSTKMKPEARFAFDSRGMEVFVQNTDQLAFEDKHTKKQIECCSRSYDYTFSIEEVIAAEVISDVSVMALKMDYAAYTKYSYSFYDNVDMSKPNETPYKIIRYAKAIG
jgi:hypothetical protein